MEYSDTNPPPPAVQLPVRLVADLQDSLLIVVHDLSRLDSLLADATENLMTRFMSVSENLANAANGESGELEGVRGLCRQQSLNSSFRIWRRN